MIYEQEVSLFNANALKSRFTAISTQFDVTLGKISAIISDSDIAEYVDGHTTMNTKLSSVVQDVAGITALISSLETDYRSGISTINSKITQLDMTIQGITASVSTTEYGSMSSDTVRYLASPHGSGITTSTSGWSTTVPTLTETNKYLWIYHTYLYTTNATYETTPVVIEEYSASGPTVTVVSPIRYLSNVATIPPYPYRKVTNSGGGGIAFEWDKGILTPFREYVYLYVCEQVEYSDGSYRFTQITRENVLVDLTKRLSSAELKITDSAIVSTVQSYQPSQSGDPMSMASYIEQQADSIRLKASRISWQSTYSSMSETGVLQCTGANITGTINAGDGSIGGWTINSTSISRNVSRGSITLGENGVTSTYLNRTVNYCGTGVWKDTYKYLLNFSQNHTDLNGENGVRLYIDDNVYIQWFLDDTGTASSTAYKFRPRENTIEAWLGSANYSWDKVYVNGQSITSDLKQKQVLENHDWKIDEFIKGLKPIAYYKKRNDNSFGKRIHMGFGAQDVSRLVKDLDIGDLSIYDAMVVEGAEDEDIGITEMLYHGEEIDDEKLAWSLQYTEFIAPIIVELQSLMERVETLEQERSN